jgi:hypothetical protein
LIRGEQGWKTRPIVFDQLQADLESGEMAGHVEVLDGRWAASLEIVPESIAGEYRAGKRPLRTAGGWRAARPHRHTTPPLLLYDVSEDPFCTKNVNEGHPELVKKYSEMLREIWKAHRSLAGHFFAEQPLELTPEQIEALRALGYIE